MNAVTEAAADLATALRGVQGVRHFGEPGVVVEPPGTVLSPPALTWDAHCVEPTEARWIAYVIVAADERALVRLLELVPRVAAALDAVTNAVVVRADPGVFATGGQELPCYQIQIEVSL